MFYNSLDRQYIYDLAYIKTTIKIDIYWCSLSGEQAKTICPPVDKVGSLTRQSTTTLFFI